MVQGLLAHSRYDIRIIIGTKSSVHDMHHELGNVNFGIIEDEEEPTKGACGPFRV
jgi:hypothetical protein